MIACEWRRRQFAAAAALTPDVTSLNANRFDFLLQHLPALHTLASLTYGRDGWVRTNESESQSLMPYRLATPLCGWALIFRLKYPRPFYPMSCQQNGGTTEGGERPGSNRQPACAVGICYLRYLAIVGSRFRPPCSRPGGRADVGFLYLYSATNSARGAVAVSAGLEPAARGLTVRCSTN